jgi:arsenate reductase-like glutaredoxin family protein
VITKKKKKTDAHFIDAMIENLKLTERPMVINGNKGVVPIFK